MPASSTTRADMVTRIRRLINTFYRDDDAIDMAAAGMDASQTSLSADNGGKFAKGDILQIEDEVMDVVSITGNVVTVRRGRKGTTKATHADNTTIDIATPGEYTDHDIEQVIADTERYMFPGLTKEYVTSIRGTAMNMVDDIDAVTGLSAIGEMGAPVLNQTDQQQGSGCADLVFNFSSTGSGSIAFTAADTTIDTRPYSYLNAWVYIEDFEDANKANKIRPDWAFDLRMGTSDTVYRSHRVSTRELDTGWNLLSVAVQDMSDTSTSTEMSAIGRFELKAFSDQSYASGDLKMDAWWLTTYPIVKTGYQRYTNPINVINVRQIQIKGRPVYKFSADQDAFELDVSTDPLDTVGTNLDQIAPNTFSTTDIPFIFKNAFTVGDPIILKGQKKPEPSNDVDNIDVRDEVLELFDLYSAQKLVEQRLAPRTNFESFSGRRNIADITSAEIITTQNQFIRRIKDLEIKLNMPGRGMSV